jgi:hypothetical protein
MSNYYYKIKSHYSGLSPQEKLDFFHSEMLFHIKTLHDLIGFLQNVNISTVKDYQRWEICINKLLPDNVDKLQDVLERELTNDTLTPYEKLEVLHYFITKPPILISSCSEIILEIITSQVVPELPSDYEQWVDNLDETARKIRDLANALLDKPRQ